ncbi:GrpB family protein [Saprospira grandis]|uniref:Glutamate-rich protein grpB n=1 Tax=Saprospira grandis (strain Lewin) TaxID=984262 RepID=H6L1E0_SAPGL|nr:GrpB family protein [Saprospira grandis]AFC23481.1 Glutamate-rich protein grpB [Saprospira grandis str. Lewin]
MNIRTIEVCPYREDWPQAFAKEKAAILSVLPKNMRLQIHHIGSTSVPGLSAKPIIDLLMEVDSLEELDQLAPKLEQLGYLVKGEFGIPGRRYFQKGEIERSHQLHAFEFNSYGAKRHLAFRDYLRQFAEHRQAYAAIKLEGARLYRFDPAAYVAHKNDFIQLHEQKALLWAEAQENN